MVSEYLTQYYEPAARDFRQLSAGGYGPTREVAAWVARVREEWPRVHVAQVEGLDGSVAAGTELTVMADVALGGLKPEEVEVHLATGLLDSDGVLSGPTLTPLALQGAGTAGRTRFSVSDVRAERSGRHGYAVRVTPRHPSLPIPFPLGLVHWSD
jgi:starch phosphorylase